MKDRFNVTPAMRDAQARAVNPSLSVWVTANAGSGKTHVLTERVLRLLVSGVRPEELLCLTYTKAAAAEMRQRVGARLAAWALLPDEALAATLATLQGAAPDPGTLTRARRLFARALDTPGGLKINTIHAFCESVLHRFPLEAGVPFDFTVIEEAEQASMIRAAREAVLAEGLDSSGALAGAAATLFAGASDFTIEAALDAALALGARLRLILTDPSTSAANLRRLLGCAESDTLEAIDREIVEQAIIPPSEYPAVAAAGVHKNHAKKLLAYSGRDAPAGMLRTFLTDKLEAPDKLNVTKALDLADPALSARIQGETLRLAELARRRAAAIIFDNSTALLTVLGAILARYDRAKRGRALVDFDDLIARVRTLLAASDMHWVAYRLDAGIAHILVDESQDTNPEQWSVVRALADEFFAGEGVDRPTRTLFAVGDEKQSIFSFQGAEPHLFGETGRLLAARAAEAELAFAHVELSASFRSLAPILSGVDLVFDNPAAHRGLEVPPKKTAHQAARIERGGFIELGRPEEKIPPDASDSDLYRDTPLDETAAERRLAERIAATIAGWIASGRALSGARRAVAPGDILILVQKRSALFHEIVAALKRKNLANAGADRLSVTGHIAVKDLMALGDVMLNPADELGLATVLRSPLFGISEAGLESLCSERKTRLWPALARRAETDPWAEIAFTQLAAWHDRLDLDRPYDFFARILYAGGGLRKLHARLGAEIDDVIAEFLDLALDHERREQPSLQGFLAGLRRAGPAVKRELSGPSDMIRVITVHGAKGLEAPIVILADAASKPAGSQLHNPVFLEADRDDATRRYLVFASGAGPSEAIENLRSEARDAEVDEYRRRLYVAMTRAEAELYVTGIRPLRAANEAEPSWYDLIEAGLGENLVDAPDARQGETVRRYPPKQVRPAPAKPAPKRPKPLLPDWLETPAPSATVRTILEPSSAGETILAAPGVAGAALARQKGIAIHALLQFLPNFTPESRAERGLAALAAWLPDDPGLRPGVLARAAFENAIRAVWI
ncbi:MAG: double-strand break repair helicase AddA, partial [Cucumibacter sp.]